MGRVSSDDYALCISAKKGLGLFLVAENAVADALMSGELVTVLDPFATLSDGLFLHYPNRTHAMPKLRAFLGFVQEHLGR